MSSIIKILRILILIPYYPLLFLIMLMTIGTVGATGYIVITDPGSHELSDATAESIGLLVMLGIAFLLTRRPFIVTFECLLRFGYFGFPFLLALIVAGLVFVEVYLLSLMGINITFDNQIILIVLFSIQGYFLTDPYVSLVRKQKRYKDKYPNDKSIFTVFRNKSQEKPDFERKPVQTNEMFSKPEKKSKKGKNKKHS